MVVCLKDEEGSAQTGRGPVTVIDIDGCIPKEGPDFGASSDAIADLYGDHLIDGYFIAKLFERFLCFLVVCRDEQEMSAFFFRISTQGFEVHACVGQRPQNATEDSRFVWCDDMEFCFFVDAVHDFPPLIPTHYTKIAGRWQKIFAKREFFAFFSAMAIMEDQPVRIIGHEDKAKENRHPGQFHQPRHL
jgi:hypothetical protein